MSYDEPLLPGTLPSTITHLILWAFNNKIHQGSLPSSLEHLEFSVFDQVIEPGVLPQSLRYLSFNTRSALFNQLITPGMLPYGLTHLLLGLPYNRDIDPITLPSTITHLSLGQVMIPLDSLESLTHLTIDQFYPVFPLQLPPSVTHLTMGYYFNRPLESSGWIPPTVTHLSFGGEFGCKELLQDGWIPNTVTHLGFGGGFIRRLTHKLIPTSASHLTLPYRYLREPQNYILHGSKSKYQSSIPSVTHLTIFFNHNPEVPARPYDLLPHFSTVQIRKVYPTFDRNPKTMELTLSKIDNSTVVWIGKKK
eukprot:gene15972-18993_t